MFKNFFSNLFSDPVSLLLSVASILLLGPVLVPFLIGTGIAALTVQFGLLAALVVGQGFDIPWLTFGVTLFCLTVNVVSLFTNGMAEFLKMSVFQHSSRISALLLKYGLLSELLLVTMWTLSATATYVEVYNGVTYVEGVGDVIGGVLDSVLGAGASVASSFLPLIVGAGLLFIGYQTLKSGSRTADV